MRRLTLIGLPVALLSLAATANAGTITAVGAVVALNNANLIPGPVGVGNFDEGPTSGSLPAGAYAAQGLTFHTGTLASILPGVTNSGQCSSLPFYWTGANFPTPIGGGGTHNLQGNAFAGAATFSVRITQVGLTASANGTQYLTAFNKSGGLIGQVTWTPSGDSAFVGLDTLGVPIGMVTFGNDDLWAGVPYDLGGTTNISDSWIWGEHCTANAQCDDGNACTTDSCNASGHCTNTTSVTCSPLDQCHSAGVCAPATGLCSNPPSADGTSCSDSNSCTQTDTCQAGVCTGANPVTCTALDGCHDTGVCDPSNGICSNPNKADGSACNDTNACTQTDTCQAGVCSGMSPVTCAPPDQCHDSGTCDMASGMCSNPAKADGSACDDSNKCTLADTCVTGACAAGMPITCPAPDQCHDVGACDPATGNCSNPNKMNGASCDDNDKCTTVDTCNNGTCSGATPVTCPTPDACHEAGSCDPTNGMCSSKAKPDGTPCPQGTCTAGTCEASGTTTSTTGSSTSSATGAGGEASTSATSSGSGGTGGDGSATNDTSGCGCREAGGEAPVGTPWALLAVGGAAAAIARRRRSRVAR